MRRVMLGFILFVIIGVVAYRRYRQPKTALEIGYAGGRQVTLWSSTAVVREPVATLNFGDQLSILNRFRNEIEVRTDKGAMGWINKGELLSSKLWETAHLLEKKAATMPVEARGHTKVLSNLHVEPGREMPRIEQISSGVPVELLAREPVELQTDQPGTEEEISTGESAGASKKEDWWLVLARTPEEGRVAGWVLGRFIDLDVPSPLPDYASAADMRIVAWFALNHVNDANGNPQPQYLVLGTKGPAGQICDFRQVRVYTWDVKRNEYETAFIDSDVCGKLPVTLTHGSASTSEVTFSFRDLGNGAPVVRTYRMRQTIVRRVGQDERERARRRREHMSASLNLGSRAPRELVAPRKSGG
jgi:hypothetical protein